MSRAAGRRGLLVAALLLLLLVAVADVVRPNSFLRGLFGKSPANPQRELLEDVRRKGIPVPKRPGAVLLGAPPAAARPRPA